MSEPQGIGGGLGMRTDSFNVLRNQLERLNNATRAEASQAEADEMQGKIDQIVQDFWDRDAAAKFPWLQGRELVVSTESGSEGEGGGDGVVGADDGTDMTGNDGQASGDDAAAPGDILGLGKDLPDSPE
jgi:hypothetical protein